MKRIHFRGIKQFRKETKEQRKKRIQAEFLRDYNNYMNGKEKEKPINRVLDEVKQILGI